jgi:outer membrane protein assembly factor BamB
MRRSRHTGLVRPLGILLAGTLLAVAEPLVAGGGPAIAATPRKPAALSAEDAAGRQILDAAGVRGGLIVHLGCGDGKLTAALRVDHRFVVHGLDAHAGNVDRARRNIQSLGLYGPVSVEQWTGKRLPYADNLVNLVVSAHLGGIPMDEVMRVLAPGGVAYVQTDGQWTRTVKPRPEGIDEWTHFLHDAGNNAVARDTVVGPPRSLQWAAPPLWLRSHETPSGFEALVCGGGRVFYLLDEGLIGITDQRLPERWALICRDAFNGKLLWRRPIAPWGWPQWAAAKFQNHDWTTITGGRTAVPNENQRRLVVQGERLYATLGYREPLSILDAATGETLATVAETAPVRQIVAADGVAVVYSQSADAARLKRRGQADTRPKPSGTLTAVRGATAAVLWRKSTPPLRGLLLAIDRGRVVWQAGRTLACRDLQSGKELWETEPQETGGRTLVATDGVLVILGQNALEARDGATGKLLWHKQVPLARGLGSEDLFVIHGMVWPSMLSVDENQKPTGRGPSALAIGYDLRTGEEQQRVFAKNLRSPEHHHRCYRNKATERYIISSMEGAEYLDLVAGKHSQNNFVRGACMLGTMPCNGMLYAPPDQCFCQPGAKLLGFTALAPSAADPVKVLPDDQRLEPGPAFGKVKQGAGADPPGDWPTYRHDAARHGATPSPVATTVKQSWRAKLGGNLTAPVCVADRVYVASRDAHTLHVLELGSGRPLWTFVAGGRIDSPPTVYQGLVLLGSADGWVYCLRADDGAMVWRFLAAPCHRRIASFDQVESAWPVHGSVLVHDGIAYVAAGRSTYLDGGIYLYGLDPLRGKILHRTTLSGPFPDGGKTVPRDVSFYIRGANSDVLASEGGAIYMRQKRLTPSLAEQTAAVLSSKGESDMGLHLFSTAGLLDGSWYNRTFWMYSQRWPGFQLANQAPKSGQLLVVDEQNTYGVKVFYRRNVHSLMFFPGKEGYLLFADYNSNEPQIVGDQGARTPVPWLPQSDFGRNQGLRRLDSPAFGLDKMIGYTRAEPPLWTLWLPLRIRAMVKAGDTLFVAGPPDVFDAKDPYAAFEGRKGADLVAVSAKDGQKLVQCSLEVPPVFDGMIAAGGRLLVALEDGSLVCLAGQRR